MNPKLPIVFIFVIVFRQNTPLQKEDNNTCIGKEGLIFCCASFEEVNGTCIECPTGSKSRQGLPCVPCEQGYYGSRCILYCQCNRTQRCDKVVGCIDQQVSSYTVYYITDGAIISTTEVHPTTGNDALQKSSGTFSNSNLLIYSGSATGIIILLGFGYLINRCRTRSKTRKTQNKTQTSEIDILNVQSEEGHGTNEVYEGVYHTIDESKMEIFDNKTRISYLESIDGETRPNRDGSKSVSSYLDAVEHETSSDSDESDNDYNKIDEDVLSYIHPYRSLEETAEDSHPYEKGCSKHTIEVKIEQCEKYENSQSFEYCDAYTIRTDSDSKRTSLLPETNSVQMKIFANQSMEDDKLSDS